MNNCGLARWCHHRLCLVIPKALSVHRLGILRSVVQASKRNVVLVCGGEMERDWERRNMGRREEKALEYLRS